MRFKKTALLAWGLFAIITVAILYNVTKAGAPLFGGAGAGENRLLEVIVSSLVPMVFALVGTLIVSRQPHNVIGWLLMMPTLLFVVSPFLPDINLPEPPPAPVPFNFWFAIWFDGTSWLMLVMPILLISLLFPTGSPPTPRWRWVIFYALGLCAFFVFCITFAEEYSPPDGASWSLLNPIGFIPNTVLEAIFSGPWNLALGALAILCFASLFVRYRRAGAVEREQIKWLLFASGVFAAIYLPSVFFNESLTGLAAQLLGALFPIGLLGIPIAIGIAILRYRLWDIDVIIRRTVTYAVVVAFLLVIYFGSVILLQQLFATVSGQRSEIITVLSTLAIAALFVPIRDRVQALIDKRFYRKKYDTQQVLQKFGETVRDETDLDKLTGELINVVQETMQPRTVGLWLKKEERGK